MSARGDAWTRYGSGALAAAWLDAVQEPFACFDTDLRLLYANRAFEKATGRPFDDCAGRPIPDLQPFGDATQSVLALLAEVRDGQSEAEEELTWCPDGSNVAQRQQVKVTVERAADGSVDSFLLTARDVTRFRETERKLRDSEAEFATLADNSPDNIIRYGLDGRATYCNQQIAERVNTTARSIVGRRPLDYVPPACSAWRSASASWVKPCVPGPQGAWSSWSSSPTAAWPLTAS